MAYLTLNGNFGNNNNDAQLIFRPLNKVLAPVSGNYYSLATNQTTDPSLRINQWSATSSNPIAYGFLYDTVFNPAPSTRTVVAGGYGPVNIIYSLDNGSTWFPASSALPSECTSFAFNGSMWVAGGGDTLLYSGDGITWTVSPNATSLIVDASGNGSVLGLAANGSLWIAAATTGLFYSYDGIYWYATTTTAAYSAVAWNGSLWVATGERVGSIPFVYSYDGITWNLAPSVSGSIFTSGLSVAWNGSQWLAGGQDASGNTLAYSYDGIHWTAQSCVLTQVAAVAWSAGLWLIGGLSATDTILYSEDGLTWVPVPDSKTLLSQCTTITWTGTVWLAGGQGTNTIIRSFDGLNWLSANNQPLLSSGCLVLTVNNVLPNAPLSAIPPPSLLLGGYRGIAYSSDGITWESIKLSPDLATCLTLLWNGSLWLGGFFGNSNTVVYSYDGLNWNISPNGSLALLDGCYALATNGQISLAGGSGVYRMIYSSNGRDWLPISSANTLFNNNTCFTIGYNGTQWIAGSDSSSNRLIYSSDPSGTWTPSASGNALFSSRCTSVAWNGAIWVAVGDTIADSSNGINWTRATTIPASSGWNTVAYNGSLWVAGGVGTTPIAYSYDGDIWRAATIPTSIQYCSSVTWTGSLWIAAGGDSSGNTASAAYSYNGITWFASPNSISVMNRGYAVAAKRLNPTAGVYLPPPVLNPVAATQPGQVVYSTGLNTLYVSSIFNVNDASGTVQIQGDLSASTINTTTLYVTSNVIVNDLSANTIGVGTLTGSNLSVEDISASTIQVWADLVSPMIRVTDMSAITISVENLFANTFEPATLNVGDISANRISVTDMSAVNVNAENLYVSGITAPIVTATRLNAGVILGTDSSLPIGTTANPFAINVTDSRTIIQSVDLSGLVQFGQGTGYGQLKLEVIGTADNPIAVIYPNASDSSGQLALYGNPTTPGIILRPGDTQLYNAHVMGGGLLIDNGSIGTDSSNPNAIVIGGGRTMVQNPDLSGVVQIGQGTGYGQLNLEVTGTADYPIASIYPNAYDSSGELGLYGGNPITRGIILRPGDTRLHNAHIVESGLLIDNGTIGKTISNPDAIVIGDTRTMVQNADLSGTVYIGNGDVSGALQLASGATGQATIQVNTPDSGQLVIGSSDTNPNAITITDTATTLKNVSFLGGLLLGNNGTIGSTAANPRAITITDTSGTIIQNADLSGTVYIGYGNRLNSLKITGGDVSGTIQSFNTIRPTVAASGEVLIGSSTANQNAIRITDTATTLKNVSFLGGLLLGNNGTIGSSTSNLNAIVVTDTSGTIFQNRGDSSGTISIGNLTSGALQLTGSSSGSTICPTVASAGRLSIGPSTANPNAIVVTDTSGTIFQNRGDLSGTISVGNPSVGALQLTSSSSGSTIRPTVASAGRLSIGSSTANPNMIVISDTSGTIFQNRGDLSGTISIGNPSRGLRITGGDTSGVAIPTGFATMRPSVSVSGCLVLGSSTRNPDAITITDTTTSIKNLSFSGGLFLGNNGTIGTTSDGSNASAITVSDTSGTIIQYLSPKSYNLPNNTISYPITNFILPGPGTYNIWSYHNNASSVQFTIRTNSLNIPGRYVLAMQLVNQNFVPPANWSSQAYLEIVTEFSGNQIITTTPLLTSLNTYSFDLVAATTTDISQGASYYPNPGITGFYVANWQNWSNGTTQILYPICASGGTTEIGSSQTNPDAITITDTATTIRNLILSSPTITSPTITGATITTSTFSGTVVNSPEVTSLSSTLTLGSSGSTTAINISDTTTTIKNLSPFLTDLGTVNNGDTLAVTGPGQYIFQKGTPSSGVTTATVNLTISGRYIFTCYTGTVGSMFLTLNAIRNGIQRTVLTTPNLNTAPPIFTYSFDVIVLNLSNLYITNITLNQVYPLYPD